MKPKTHLLSPFFFSINKFIQTSHAVKKASLNPCNSIVMVGLLSLNHCNSEEMVELSGFRKQQYLLRVTGWTLWKHFFYWSKRLFGRVLSPDKCVHNFWKKHLRLKIIEFIIPNGTWMMQHFETFLFFFFFFFLNFLIFGRFII